MVLPYALIGIGTGLLLLKLTNPKKEKESRDGKVHAVGQNGINSSHSDSGSVKRRHGDSGHRSGGLTIPIKDGASEDEREAEKNAKTNHVVFSSTRNHYVSQPSTGPGVGRKDEGVTHVRNRNKHTGKDGVGDNSHDVSSEPGGGLPASNIQNSEGSVENATASPQT
jgi:hypothetical protein